MNEQVYGLPSGLFCNNQNNDILDYVSKGDEDT